VIFVCKDDDCSKRHAENKCQCPGGKMIRFVEPCLLFLLSQKSSYGYELMEKLDEFGFQEGKPDSAMTYRTLRSLEKGGCVVSQWDTKGAGPAKRNYKLTAQGLSLLHEWAEGIEFRKQVLGKFLKLYKKQFKRKK
jgi:PadR family transcriptional regulator, regulatory protein PadR